MVKLVGYIVSKAGCLHPFRISRILVLANWKALEKLGRPLASFRIDGFEAGFYIPGFKEALEEDECFRTSEEKKCVEYICQPPSLGEKVESMVDSIIQEVSGLNDSELNKLIVRDKRYRELLARGGF